MVAASRAAATSLAYDDQGTGTPVVFLHGLTFDRRSWRPILERLDDSSTRSIAIDLPAHGQSTGAPAPFDEVCARLHDLLDSLAADRPIIVGHSMSGGLASSYAAAYPTRGVVVVENGPDIRPFARLLQHLEPALRGPGFADAWRTFEDSLGLERIPEPTRTLVLETHQVTQDVVVGYFEAALRTDPEELQALIDTQIRQVGVPYLAVFGRPITDGERERLGWLPDVEVEERVGEGHFVHLVDPDRFATRLRRFIDARAADSEEDGSDRPAKSAPIPGPEAHVSR
jgi:pimeloyl-ACP methyl ester carboxylesterase